MTLTLINSDIQKYGATFENSQVRVRTKVKGLNLSFCFSLKAYDSLRSVDLSITSATIFGIPAPFIKSSIAKTISTQLELKHISSNSVGSNVYIYPPQKDLTVQNIGVTQGFLTMEVVLNAI